MCAAHKKKPTKMSRILLNKLIDYVAFVPLFIGVS